MDGPLLQQRLEETLKDREKKRQRETPKRERETAKKRGKGRYVPSLDHARQESVSNPLAGHPALGWSPPKGQKEEQRQIKGTRGAHEVEYNKDAEKRP